jgi:DNA-binding response OmpR family regulator
VDDVVSKPPSMKLLVARIAALLRRSSRPPVSSSVLSLGSLTLDLERYELQVEGQPVPVSPKEFRVMATLLKAGGRVLSRNELLRQALGTRARVTDRCADAYIIRLRRKLRAASGLLKTVRGFGYALRAEGT